MQQLTKLVEDYARDVGLHINAGKTKLVHSGAFEGEEVNTIQVGGGET